MSLRLSSMAGNDQSPESMAPESANAPLTTPFAGGGTDTAIDGPSRFGAASKHSGVIVLLIVVVAASGALYAMRSLGKATKLNLVEIKIDYPVDGATKIATADHVHIMDDLRTSGEVRRVPLEEVQMNPFEWRGLEVVTAVPGGRIGLSPEEQRLREAQERAKAIETAFARLSLNSIIGGRVPVARVSGQMVRVGDTVGEHFRVVHIGGREARLEADGRVYTLTLGE